MNQKNMSWFQVFILVGATMAFLIGSGFASGQETVQYFTGYGVFGSFMVATINCVMIYVAYMAYGYAGRTRNLKNLNEVMTFYAGPVIGKICEFLAWLFVACCYFFMCSGAASTMNQQWGLPIWIGLVIIIGLSLLTAIMGLKRIVDIIGWIGPVITVFTLIIGLISAFTYFPKITEGITLLNSGEYTISRAGVNWLTAGLSFGGCSMLLASNFVATLAHDYKEYKYGRFKLVLFICAFLDSYISMLMGLNHLGNIAESSVVDIPNLALANHILGSVGMLFAIIICVAIYSTVCPCLWNTISFFIKDDKTAKYKTGCIIMAAITFFVCLVVPYKTLLGMIMTYCGYSGALVFAIIVVCFIRVRSKDKAAGITDSSTVEV